VDFNYIAPGGETFGGKIETVDTERKILKNEVAVGGNLEAALEAVAFAEEFAAGGEAGPLGIADFEMNFATEALGVRGEAGGEKEETCQHRQAREKSLEATSDHC
jgi:hypothetical protein